MSNNKENLQQKGYLKIAFKSAISTDICELNNDLSENPNDPYLKWLAENMGNNSELVLECSAQLVDALADYEKEHCGTIDGYGLESVGETIGEESFVTDLVEKCNKLSIKKVAQEYYEDVLASRYLEDTVCYELEGEEREEWKALLRRNISRGLEMPMISIEDYKEDFEDWNPDEEKPSTDEEWIEKYVDEQVDWYCECMDDTVEEEKQLHLEDSGLISKLDGMKMDCALANEELAEREFDYDYWWVEEYWKE